MPFENQNDQTPESATTSVASSAEEPATVAMLAGESESDARTGSPSASYAEISEELRQLTDEVGALRRDLHAKFLYDDAKQRQLDTMHTELQEHRQGMHFQLLRPVFTDLIALLDGMSRVSARLAREQEDPSTSSQAVVLNQFREQIEETLERNGVQTYTSVDSVFDRERQRAIGVVETNDLALDKRVADRVRPGYIYDGRIVVQAEQVKTYRYSPSADAPDSPIQE